MHTVCDRDPSGFRHLHLFVVTLAPHHAREGHESPEDAKEGRRGTLEETDEEDAQKGKQKTGALELRPH